MEHTLMNETVTNTTKERRGEGKVGGRWVWGGVGIGWSGGTNVDE